MFGRYLQFLDVDAMFVTLAKWIKPVGRIGGAQGAMGGVMAPAL